MLESKSNNYLLAISFDIKKGKENFGLVYLDASTGDFYGTEIKGKDKLLEEIRRVGPSEVLLSDLIDEDFFSLEDKQLFNLITKYKDVYDEDASKEILFKHFGINSYESIGLKGKNLVAQGAACLLDYLQNTQKITLAHIKRIKFYENFQYMYIDTSTLRNLEIFETVKDSNFVGSFLWVLDRTKTSMGARLLKQYVRQPLLNVKKIESRLAGVEELSKNNILREKLANMLTRISDIERLSAKTSAKNILPRELVALKESLELFLKIKSEIKDIKSKILAFKIDPKKAQNLIDLISRAVVDEPPLHLKEGGIIKKGFNSSLDEIREISHSGKKWITEMEEKERKRTGIKSLKVGFTKVFGYYIEVSTSNLKYVPEDYIRKQTLVNGERFITPELKEKEALILNAEEKINEQEYSIFCDLRDVVSNDIFLLQEISRFLAKLDVFVSFADVSVSNHYVRPTFNKESKMKIVEGRHPVIELTIGRHKFVPNNAFIDNKTSSFLLITGPNMAGKSTYMRQIALITLMAQIGCFVPAKEADLCVVDRIFSRIGAMDNIFSGHSTFMLEMLETSNILRNATQDSLIILDEIGRGTATFDGMSIAAAVAEYIHENINAKTLFATHYHEITYLPQKYKGMTNLNVSVLEKDDKITFLYKIVEGPADKSYGIQVAQLAGLPENVIEKAKEIYKKLDQVEHNLGESEKKPKKKKVFKKSDKNQMDLF
jgi:DNA mismatch repair protein MutS